MSNLCSSRLAGSALGFSPAALSIAAPTVVSSPGLETEGAGGAGRERGWEDEARRAWNTTSFVERLVVSRHDQPPFDALGSILLSVDSVADALLNLSGREQEERRRAAVEWARLAEDRIKAAAFDAHLASAARGAVLLSEGSVANHPPT